MGDIDRDVILFVLSAFGSALLLCVVGGLALFFGWRIYRISLAVFCVLLGGALGAWLAARANLPWPALALPIGFITGCFTLAIERVIAFLIFGIWAGAVVLYGQEASTGIWIAGGAAFLLGGCIGVLIWRPAVLLYNAVLGATLITAGFLTAAAGVSPMWSLDTAEKHPWLLALAIGLLAIPGFIFQVRMARRGTGPAGKKASRKS